MSVKGSYFGEYLLLAQLAQGGMAQVCVGKRFGAEGFERLVAIKQLLPEFSKDEKFVTMFIDEAKIASQLNHANICQIYDLGTKDNTLFIAMEYIHGRDISSIIKRCNAQHTLMPVNLAAAAIAKIADALDYAHRKKDQNGQPLGIIHRDISPQNILISFEGDCKLIDFGIAKAKDRAAKTQAGIIKGKFFYMSPEQITDRDIDGRTDIFALGAVLYELLTGVPAFKGSTDVETIRNVATCHYLPVNHYNRHCPKSLCKIVDKAMAADRQMRYQRAAEMSADLQRFLLNEAEPVSGQDLSEYLTALFASEWSEEAEKIKYFRSVKAPAREEADQEVCSLEKTIIASSYDVSSISSVVRMPTEIASNSNKRRTTGTGKSPSRPIVNASQLMVNSGACQQQNMGNATYVNGGISYDPRYQVQVATKDSKKSVIILAVVLAFVVVFGMIALLWLFMPEFFGSKEATNVVPPVVEEIVAQPSPVVEAAPTVEPALQKEPADTKVQPVKKKNNKKGSKGKK